MITQAWDQIYLCMYNIITFWLFFEFAKETKDIYFRTCNHHCIHIYVYIYILDRILRLLSTKAVYGIVL